MSPLSSFYCANGSSFLGQLRLQLSQGEVLMGNMQIAFWLGS